MSRPSAIVVGTGRSGTSTVADILHNQLGVCMGHHLKMQLPGGAYEDYLAHGLNRMVMSGALSAGEWLEVMSKCHRDHWKCKKWGAKDPWFLYWPIAQLQWLAPALIVRTWRAREEVTRSWLAIRRYSDGKEPPQEMRAHFERLYDEREARADALEKAGLNMMTIRFDRRLSDEEISAQIAERMEDVRLGDAREAKVG